MTTFGDRPRTLPSPHILLHLGLAYMLHRSSSLGQVFELEQVDRASRHGRLHKVMLPVILRSGGRHSTPSTPRSLRRTRRPPSSRARPASSTARPSTASLARAIGAAATTATSSAPQMSTRTSRMTCETRDKRGRAIRPAALAL